MFGLLWFVLLGMKPRASRYRPYLLLSHTPALRSLGFGKGSANTDGADW